MNYHQISNYHVAAAALLILINAAISLLMQLKLERMLAIAAVRTVVQLLLVGLVLEWVFRLEQWWLVVAILSAMTLVAGLTASSRNQRGFPGVTLNTLISVWASSWLVTGVALFGIMQGIDNWYQPQYAIPLLGMVLGNTLNGISLGLNTFTSSLATRRSEVETALALGATRWEAARGPVQESLRTGLIPITNSMMVVGIVSLPGMMTGQIMAGAAPVDAVKYQIMIMFLIASATAMGVALVVLLSYLRLFNKQHQFLFDLLQNKK